MSQRIQSIILFLSAVAFGLLFFMPLAKFYGEVNILEFNIFGVTSGIPGGESPFGNFFTLPILILTVVMVLLSLYLATSLFRAVRVKQLLGKRKILRANIILAILWAAAVFFFYMNKIGHSIDGTVNYEIGIFMPLVGMVLMIIASIGIKKDIDKVRSMDRLR